MKTDLFQKALDFLKDKNIPSLTDKGIIARWMADFASQLNYFQYDRKNNSWISVVDWYFQPISESLPESQSEDKIMSIDVEKILYDTMFENGFTYVSFPAFVENESSVDVFDITCKAMGKIFTSQFSQSQHKVVTDEINPDFNFFRTNILRHLSTEDMIALRNWLNGYENIQPKVTGNEVEKTKYYRCKKCNCVIKTDKNTPYWVPTAEAHQKERGEKLCFGNYVEITKEEYDHYHI